MMTKDEKLGKREVIRILNEAGYATYALIFSHYDLKLTTNPNVIGFMEPGKARITVNRYLNSDQVSVVIRHEILHEILKHAKRLETKGLPMSRMANIAADYEISNRGYTEADKENIRTLRVGDQVYTGLVTEDEHPDWTGLTFEEMLDKLMQESPESLKDPVIGRTLQDDLKEAEELSDQAGDMAQGSTGSKGQEEGSKVGSSSSNGDSNEDNDQEGEGSGDGDSKKEGDKKKQRQHYDDEEYQKMSPEEKKKERARRRKEAAKKLKEEADKLIDEIKGEVGNGGSGKGEGQEKGGPGGKGLADDTEIFESPEEQRDIQARLQEIKKILDNPETMTNALDETTNKRLDEKAVQAAKDAKKYRESPLIKFTESLNRFIKKALAVGRHSEWSRINKKYVYSGLLKPGTSMNSRNKVPLINVYFDRSGSWTETKTALGRQAIATLNRYVTRGELKINLYYFSEGVHSRSEVAEAEGGTNGQPILDHIEQTKPDNVIVMTDSDISDCTSKVVIPGVVWLLFYGSKSSNLINHLSGRTGTQIFMINGRDGN